MSSPHNQTDQLLDEILNHKLHHNTDAHDDDAEILQELVDLYRADTLSPSAKYRIFDKARAEISPNKRKRHILLPSYRERVGRLAAAFAIVVGMMFVLNAFRISQYNTALTQQIIPTPPLVMLPTIIPINASPTPVPSPTPLSVNTLMGNIPQLSPAFGFEYGGYIMPDTSEDMWGTMYMADMKWVAFSVTDSPEDDVLGIREQIKVAHQQGFKVLISVQGSKIAMGNIPQSYTQTYTDYVAQFVLSGADAIEIWAGANVDRNWSMELGIEGYAELLTQTIQTIRELNPQTLIVAGAPVTTGAESAFEGQVINDDNFLRQLLEMGALGGVDCVGMRYVEGTVPPLATSGDIIDDDYRRYLPMMLETYREIVGAQMPICVTSIGYFSSDGYSDVPELFQRTNAPSWQERQIWLTDAMEWLSLQVDVPLAIIWHINLHQVSDTDEVSDEIYQGYALSN